MNCYYRTRAIIGSSRLVAVPLRFQAKPNFYVPGEADGTLCSEMAENVQKVTLVGSFNFGSSWHPFGGFT